MSNMNKKIIVLPLLSVIALASFGLLIHSNKNILEESTILEGNATKLVKRSESSAATLSNVLKVQVSDTKVKNGENVKSIRFVAGISSLNIVPHFERAEINVDDKVIMPQRSISVSCAYSSITYGKETKTASQIFGEGYEYLISYTLSDIPEQYWFTPIDITLKVEGSDTSVNKIANVAALAEEYQNSSDYSFYKIDDDNVAIGLVNMELEEVNIPEYYLEVENTDTTLLGKRIRITSVGYYELSQDTKNNIFFMSSSLKSVNIPEGVKNIGSYCFYGSSLTSIKLPQSLTSIENCAFIETNSLEQIILPKNVVLGNSVFGAHHSNFKIYFEGNDVPASWKNVDWSHGINAPVSDHFFLYSETEPTGISTYSYWHYDANNNPVLW